MSLNKLFATAALLIAPALAFAHPGHGDNGLVAGISHPLGGLDHLWACGPPSKKGPRAGRCRARLSARC
jgi:hypothetical protein